MVTLRTATVVGGGYRVQPEPLEVISRAAKAAKALRSRTCGRLYLYDALLERLVEEFQNVPFAIRESTSERASLAHDGNEG
jgi:hypothetical protein